MDKRRCLFDVVRSYGTRKRPFRRTVTFAAPASTLADFPALVKLPAGAHVDTGYDVAFETLDGAPLPFELDFYDATTGAGAWWVKLPTLAAGSPTTIRMTYGDASVTTDQSSAATVWSDYSAVFHCNTLSTTAWTNSATGTSKAWSDSAGLGSPAFTAEHSATGRGLVLPYQTGGMPAIVLQSGQAANTNAFTLTAMVRDLSPAPILCMVIGNSACISSRGIRSIWSANDALSPPSGGDSLCRYKAISSSSSGALARIDTATASIGTGFRVNATYYAMNCHNTSAGAYVGTVYVDEIRSRFSSVSEDWLEYEYNNSINHNAYTTYGGESR